MESIQLRGARTHNLQNVDLDLPRDRLIVITGLSGSGKSSLAFDTIYAEGQRRYVESLSAYARQFLSIMEKPDIDHIEGLSPAISIEQKSTSHNPRSTVGTVTEIHDYLRLLYARAGTPKCPEHGIDLNAQTISQMVDQVLELPEGRRLMLLAPVVQNRKGGYVKLLAELQAQGLSSARIDGQVIELDSAPDLDLHQKHDIEVVVDRFRVRPDLRVRLAESFETAVRMGDGLAKVAAGTLAPETFGLRFVQLPEPSSGGTGSILRVEDGVISRQPYAPGRSVGEAVTVDLEGGDFTALVSAIRQADPETLPVNLWSEAYLEIEVRVLQHRRSIMARPFSRLSGQKGGEPQQRFDRLVAALREIESSRGH